MAKDLSIREGAVQSVMAAYLLTYGVSQLVYGPLSDRVGRRPVILVGMSIFMVATMIAITTHSLTVLIAASALQGVDRRPGLWRVPCRVICTRARLRHANSLLNMGILVSPLLAPLIGGLLDTVWSGAPVMPSCWCCALLSPSAWGAGCRKPAKDAPRTSSSPATKRCSVMGPLPVIC
ncbi:MFS transporter [Enterobacter hormaechei]